MVLAALALAAAAVEAPPPATESVVRQAVATVRIVAGERIGLTETPAIALVRTIVVETSAGQPETRRLIEYP